MTTVVGQWLVFAIFAALIGFFADRASFCTVKAVEEVFSTRKAYMLLSIAKLVLWVSSVTIWLVWWLGVESSPKMATGLAWSAVVGGLLFGVGAVLNGGCAIATLTRLGRGNFGMLLTLIGLVSGIAIIQAFDSAVPVLNDTRAAPLVSLDKNSATVLGLCLSIWVVWELIRMARTTQSPAGQASIVSRPVRLSVAAAVIGASNGVLYAHLGTWSYTHTIGISTRGWLDPSAEVAGNDMNVVLWSLFLALILGIAVSAIRDRKFTARYRPELSWVTYFTGGIIMGVGAGMIPGGNDVLLFNAIPGMSPHGLPAFIAILAGIWLTLLVRRKLGLKIEQVSCTGDRCYLASEQES